MNLPLGWIQQLAGVIDNLILDAVKRLGATAMTISHDMASVRRIADVVAMIHEGRLSGVGLLQKCMIRACRKYINLCMAIQKAR